MIKVVVCDGDGTLGIPTPSTSIHKLLKKMGDLKIGLVVATNSTKEQVLSNFKKSGLPLPSIIVTPKEVGENKPSPKFIKYISSQTGIEPNEMVFLGDNDETDIFCAINSHVLPFASLYSSAGQPKYGIPVSDPLEFLLYLNTYGRQDPPFFGWSIALPKEPVEVYALIGNHGSMGITIPLKNFLKNKQDVQIGSKKNSLGSVLFHYFLSQSYLSGLIQDINYVSVYPGHDKGSGNQILSQYSDILQKTLGRRYLPELLIRHTTTPPSHLSSGSNRDIYQQLSTIRLNEEYKKRIRGKRILVLDDFTTTGNSLETARVMLLNGGAANVVGLAFAKYRNTYNVVNISQDWDSYESFTPRPDRISTIQYLGAPNQHADDFFSEVILKAAQS